MKNFNLLIITPEQELLKNQVYSVSCNTPRGAVMVLANHEPFFIQLTTGVIKVQLNEGMATSLIFLINPLLVVDTTGCVITAEEGFILEKIDMQFALNYIKKDKIIGNLLVEALRRVVK